MAARAFLFLTSSARPGGNALALARHAAAHLPAQSQHSWEDLAADPLPAFLDQRPALPQLTARAQTLLHATIAATDLVLVAPIYWYALPAPAKLYLDHWSAWLDLPEPRFTDAMRTKRLWLITTRADPAKAVTAPVEGMLKMTADWMGLHWAGALHGVADAPGDIANDHPALAHAACFFT